jgi:heme-degrading monooxygenase HmoA
MWGTIARMRVKPGHERALMEMMSEDLAQNRPPGFVSSLVYRSAGDPQEYWLAVAFESEEAYRKNADSPDQDAEYRRMLEHLEEPPEWHDGEIVQSV